MGANTLISWATHTFNGWMGCTKVSPACAHCYAERDMDHRYGKVQWGPQGNRVLTSDANWKKPIKWNKEAGEKGIRYRVFCSSLADVFEDWKGPIVDNNGWPMHRGLPWHVNKDLFPIEGVWIGHSLATMQNVRERLFKLIDATPNLDWLLLTKRPENVRKFWTCPQDQHIAGGCYHSQHRKNVWLGTSVENPEYAEKRIPELLKCRDLSPCLWLSCEPLLGRLDLVPWIGGRLYRCKCGYHRTESELLFFGGDDYKCAECNQWCKIERSLDWVISGGESGPEARPSHPGWYRSLRDQCQAAGVPFHHKQNGEWCSVSEVAGEGKHYQFDDGATVRRIGVVKAGRTLDGVIHDAFPVETGEGRS